MTRLLKKAIERLSRLSEEQQNAIAAWLLDELEDEHRWDRAFAGTEENLGRWAKKVREDIASGRYRQMDVDDL